MTRVERLGRRLAAENSRWRVFLDHIRDEAGREVPDYLVVEPKVALPGAVTGVAVLPVMDDRVVLLPVWRHAIAAQGFELVKGFIDAGETAAEGALRELAEETGLACDPADLAFIGNVAPEPSTLAGKGALFIARDCRPASSPSDDEIGLAAPRAFATDELDVLIRDGAIEDAMTLVACLSYLRR
ncbi:NUDIX hydrolase [Desertibaculum subflavum]|uniref:NUDIX hydrolase n=1 Tax=Desertibaculum subflavum TaxID=2268458 RepID=UPI000E65EE4D